MLEERGMALGLKIPVYYLYDRSIHMEYVKEVQPGVFHHGFSNDPTEPFENAMKQVLESIDDGIRAVPPRFMAEPDYSIFDL